MRISISAAIRAFTAVSAIIFVLNAFVALFSLTQLRVGGPLYTQIAMGKDLIGDILPPPEYIIEAYLEATLAKAQPSTLAERRAALGRLHQDFDGRRAYWRGADLPADLKDGFEAAARAAAPFWAAVDDEMLPALAAGDAAKADAAYGKAVAAYAAHRAAVDRLVTDANAFNAALERTAADRDRTYSFVLYATSATGLLILLLGALYIVARAVRPLVRMTRAMGSLATGDLQTLVPSLERRDEIGAMAASMQTFKEAAIAKCRMEAETGAQQHAAAEDRARQAATRAEQHRRQQAVVTALAAGLQGLAKGDLTSRLDLAFAPEYETLRGDFNETAASLEKALGTIAGVAAVISSGSDEIATASDDLSKRTEHQAASLEETAAALDLITTTVKKMAHGAGEAAHVVVATRTAAETSGRVVDEAVTAMGMIKDSSTRITDIIGVIDEIAFQTNLLALNAGVEAARAGEAGRGFAVVASEVRALAQRSADAAREIKGLIAASTEHVDSGVLLVGRMGASLKEILEKVAEVDVLVREMSASSREQATSLAEVNIAVTQMDQVVQQNAAMAGESTAAAQSLRHQTDGLTIMVGRFRFGTAGVPARAPNAVHAQQARLSQFAARSP